MQPRKSGKIFILIDNLYWNIKIKLNIPSQATYIWLRFYLSGYKKSVFVGHQSIQARSTKCTSIAMTSIALLPEIC